MGDSEGDPQNNTDLRTSGSYDGPSAIRDVMGRNNIIPLFQENAMVDSQNRIDEANIDTGRDIKAAATSYTVNENVYSFFTKSMHDNGYVSHPIPRSNNNYSWITASLGPNWRAYTVSGFPIGSDSLHLLLESDVGYHAGVSVTTGQPHTTYGERIFSIANNKEDTWLYEYPDPDITFTNPTVGGQVDFVGTNTIIAEPVNTVTNYLGWPEDVPLVAASDTVAPFIHTQYLNKSFIQMTFESAAPYAFNGLIHHRQGPYGWPSWKQIRGSQHPIVRAQHKQNEFTFVLSDADEIETSSSLSGRRVIRPRYGKIHYYDRTSPVTTKFKPIESTINISTKMRNSFGKDISKSIPIDINTTYGNELVFFNREAIDKELDLSRTKAPAYEEVKDMFTRGALETSLSPITAINKFVYKETIYPSHQNMYSADIRIKKDYKQNFWRNTHAERTALAPKTIHGNSYYGRDPSWAGDDISALDDSASGFVYTHFGEHSKGRPSMSVWPLDHATGAMTNVPNSSYAAIFAHGGFASDLVGREKVNYRTDGLGQLSFLRGSSHTVQDIPHLLLRLHHSRMAPTGSPKTD